VIARFVPIIRTFVPAVAGAARMRYRSFVAFNIVGGTLWVFSTVLLGYGVGSAIPNIDKYLHVVIGIVIALSLIPLFWNGTNTEHTHETPGLSFTFCKRCCPRLRTMRSRSF
jgi:membrane-associated protein